MSLDACLYLDWISLLEFLVMLRSSNATALFSDLQTQQAPMAAPTMASPLPPPSEEAIHTLVSMGFDRNQAVRALAQARNDVHLATNLLLEAIGH
jgi:Holliday junction resolvasome RuvABC DNA-binding subunit